MSDKNDLQEKILGYIENSNSPVTIESICSDISVSRYAAERIVSELVMGNKVRKVISQNPGTQRREYFTDTNRVINYEEYKNNESTEIIQSSVNVQAGYKELEEKVDLIDENVTGIYTNIISIMSILVAIFALITVNANITLELAQENLQNTFNGIIVMNVVVVICILVLLVGIKFIIIDPMKKKKNQKKMMRGSLGPLFRCAGATERRINGKNYFIIGIAHFFKHTDLGRNPGYHSGSAASNQGT